jgi:mannose-1-phosphate guanylyltransferase
MNQPKKILPWPYFWPLALLKKMTQPQLLLLCLQIISLKKTLSFTKTIKQSFSISNRHQQIFAIGIKPTFSNPSFGYIVPQKKNQSLSHINLFIEKPDIDTAQTLIKKGAFWNSGIYTFPANFLINEYQNLQPDFKKIVEKIFTEKDL